MSTPRQPFAQTLRPKPLVACLATVFALASTSTFAASYAGGMEPLPAAKAVAVASARAKAKTQPIRQPAIAAVTNCNDSGSGSLRAALSGAVNNDTIDLSHLTCSTITLTTGALLAEVDNLTLQGPADHHLTIDGGANAQHYNQTIVHSGDGGLFVYDLNITGGKYQNGDGLGGCIFSSATVVLKRSTVHDCTAANLSASGNASGGGIWANKNVILQYSSVTGNTAISENADAFGGGVYAREAFNSFYSTLSGNQADGAGISKGGGAITMGSLGIGYSTLSGNTAQIGGGLFIDGRYQTFMAEIDNSTFSGNTATDRTGGIFSRVGMTMKNDTVVLNTEHTSTGAGIYLGGNSIIISTMMILNTTQGANFDLGGASGVTVSGDHNMVNVFQGSLGLSPVIPGSASDILPLADNGGVTRTHALPSNSHAINKGYFDLTYDQRGPGFGRSIGNGADIGAFEYNPDIIFINGFN